MMDIAKACEVYQILLEEQQARIAKAKDEKKWNLIYHRRLNGTNNFWHFSNVSSI